MKLVDEIKKLIQEFSTPAPAPVVDEVKQEATEVPLADGSMVTVDKLEVGGSVLKDGQPVGEGELTLADGSVIVCDASGVITELKPAAEAAPVDPNEDFRNKFTAFESEWTTYKQSFAAIQTEFSAAKETIGRQEQAIKQLMEMVKTLAETPVAAPAEAPVAFENMTPLEQRRYLRSQQAN